MITIATMKALGKTPEQSMKQSIKEKLLKALNLDELIENKQPKVIPQVPKTVTSFITSAETKAGNSAGARADASTKAMEEIYETKETTPEAANTPQREVASEIAKDRPRETSLRSLAPHKVSSSSLTENQTKALGIKKALFRNSISNLMSGMQRLDLSFALFVFALSTQQHQMHQKNQLLLALRTPVRFARNCGRNFAMNWQSLWAAMGVATGAVTQAKTFGQQFSLSFARHFTLLFTLVHILMNAPTASAADPTAAWTTIETPHFIIVHEVQHGELAEAYARFAEQAFQAITPNFGVWPSKTVLVIDDSTDQANGFATSLPYPLISVYPVLPTALDGIGDYGNWGYELILHEYAHILSFEPTSGFISPLRSALGTIIRPNALLPRWYLEGLAIEIETRHSNHGRLRSPNYLAIPRAMIEENSLRREDIARINESSIPDWPGGARPYLMGALLWSELTRRGGESTIRELNETYSGRVPFLIDDPVQSKFGLNYTDLLNEVYTRMESNARQQLATIGTAAVTQTTEIPQSGFFNHSPRVSPDRSMLAFIVRDHNIDSAIALTKRNQVETSFTKGQTKRALTGSDISRLSWLPDSTGFIYDSTQSVSRYRQVSDLWRYDLPISGVGEGRKTQITRGLRAREPVVSPDGKSIVFVQITPGSTKLSSMKIDGSHLRTLWSAPLQGRISHPEFLTDEKIVFSERQKDGQERLCLLHVTRESDDTLVAASEEPRFILENERSAQFPRATDKGLLFTSDRTGVANLYLASADLSSARSITNVTTRALMGELDPLTGELLFSRLSANGPRIVASARDAWERAPQDPPRISPLIEDQWSPPSLLKSDIQAIQMEAKPYEPSAFLLPRYWLPLAFLGPEGLYLQASTSSADPIGQHSYSLSAGYDTLTNRPSLSGQYMNRSTPTTYSLGAQDYFEAISSGINRRTSSASFSASFDLPQLDRNWSTGLGGRYLQTELSDGVITRSGASAFLSWSNASRSGHEISPESGSAFSLVHTSYLPTLGSISYDQTDFSASTYFSRWLPERHALAFSLTASLAPRLNRAILGRTTLGGTYQNAIASGIPTGVLMRGYASGTFIGKNLVSSTAEYRFPLRYVYSGWGTKPFFLRRLHAAVFTDAITLDGFVYGPNDKTYQLESLGRFFFGSGLEVKADTTLFYHLPAQFILGLYFGLDNRANPQGPIPFFGLSI